MSLKSKSVTFTILIHVLTWLVLGFILFGYQPLTMNIELPYQFWIKQNLIFFMLVGSFYLNSAVLVPQYLLKNRTGVYFLIVIFLVIAIYFLNILFDSWLHMHQLMDAAFHKHGPPRRGE